MELSFLTKPMNFLRCIMREVHFQEETTDTIVPDSYPDIASILDCYAEVILRGKDCRNGSVMIAGGIKGGILYRPDDGTGPHILELYLPFTMKFENQEITDHAQVVCSLRIRTVDCRMINSRKAMLRVGIGCELQIYEQASEFLYSLTDVPENLQIKQETYYVELPLETSEKSFSITESIMMNGRPPIHKICKVKCETIPVEQRLVGNKAIFKGQLNVKLQYLTEEKELYTLQQSIPYSQYCELAEEYDNETVSVAPVITGYDLEENDSDKPQEFVFNAHILLQCLVHGSREMPMITDAYCIQGELQPQWCDYTIQSCLDRQINLQSIRMKLNGSVKEIIDTDVYWDYPIISRKGDQIRIVVPATVRILCKDEKNELYLMTDKGEIVQELLLSGDSSCTAVIIPAADDYAAITGDGVELRSTVSILSTCYSGTPLQTLSGGTIEEDKGVPDKKPSVIVRHVPKNSLLWDLAKLYRTTEASICAVNHLDGNCTSEDMLLLLPIGSR